MLLQMSQAMEGRVTLKKELYACLRPGHMVLEVSVTGKHGCAGHAHVLTDLLGWPNGVSLGHCPSERCE